MEGKDYKTDQNCFPLALSCSLATSYLWLSGSLALWLSSYLSLSLSLYLSLSLLTDSQLCMLKLRDLLLQGNKYLYYYNMDSEFVSYSVMMFVRKLPQQFGVRQWDSLDVTSGPDSGRRLITLELKSSNPTSQKRLRDEGPFRCWDQRDRPLESKRTQVAQNDISGKSQLNSI